MKNMFKTLAAVALIALAASCSKDAAEAPAVVDETAKVSFTVELPGVVSRATNDGTTATELHYAVYQDNGDNTNTLLFSTDVEDQVKTMSSLSTTVELDLVSQQTYDIVFWAQAPGAYDPDFTAKSVAMNYNANKVGSNEERDAFVYVWNNLTVNGSINETVTLRRPFAQLNVALTDGQIEAAQKAGFTLDQVKVSAKTHNAFGFFAAEQGAPVGEMIDIEFAAADYELTPNTIKVNNVDYDWVSFNYLLACTPSELVDVTIVFENENDAKTIEVPAFTNVPIERNHRTNIVGDLLTDPAKFNVVILPGFDEEGTGDHNILPWDGKTTKAPAKDANNNYIIAEASELAWLADQVNGVSRAAIKTFKGETFLLTKDIDLAGHPWMPIGPNADASAKFQGTLDGQDHIISNLNVNTPDGYTAAGLFGALHGTVKNLSIENATIKHISTSESGATDNGIAVVAGSLYNVGHVINVHVKNAKVEGNRYMGGISGYTYGNVKNCSVENIELIATPNAYKGGFDNGDKVGGIAGAFWSEGVYAISGNTAKNVTIKGYRDLGGIVGSATAAAVTGNTVEGTITIIADQLTNSYGPKDVNAAAIVGRCTSGEVGSSNVSTAEVTISQQIQDGVAKDLVTDDFVISNAAGLKWVADVVNATTPYTETIFDDKIVKLANDIDLKNEEWIPIGDDRSQRTEWHGIFDGQGYTVKNVKITKKTDRDDANKSSYGLFGNVKGTVKNLTVENVSVSGAPKFIGALIGRLNDGLVENCHVKNSQVACNNWTIGGVVGQWNNGKISGCSIEGSTITGYAAAGAIAGIALNAGERTVENCSVKNCQIVQNGSFGGDYDKMFGAIVGAVYNGALTVNINGCTVEGTTICGEASNALYGYVSEGDKVLVDGWETISEGLGYNATLKAYGVSSTTGLVTLSNTTIKGAEKVVLTADIDLAGVEFSGLSAFNPEPNNIFDGQGHTVSNWTNESGASDMGFIKGWVGTIKNVTIKNAHLKTSGRSAVLAGKVYATIENCHVIDSSIEDSYWACGILAGLYNGGSVKNCSVSGSSVKSNGGTGGIVGVMNESAGERGFYNCTVTNTTVNNTGAYGESYCGALICGMINCDATVTFEGCSYEGNTKEGKYVGDLYYGNPSNVIVK